MATINEGIIPVPAATNNRPSPPRYRTPVGTVPHHMAGYLPGTDGIFQNPATGYATNYGIGSADGENYVIHEYVPDNQVAYGNGNDDLNARAVSIEHENNRAQGYASKPVDEVHELSARFHAALAIKWGWRVHGQLGLVLADFPNHDYYERAVPDFGVHFNVTGHRSVALKNCPNDLDMAWIVNRANRIISTGIQQGEDTMLTFITDNPAGAWYATDGKEKWALAPGGNQLLVDLGLAKWPDGRAGNVKILSPGQIASIPTRGFDVVSLVDDIAAAILGQLPTVGGGVAPSAADIAAAVREAFRTDPLS